MKYNAKVLIACEESQTVCTAFRMNGIEAYSNDINKCYGGHPEWHIIGDALSVIRGHAQFQLENGAMLQMPGFWDMIIAHPPCTMLTHCSAVALASGKHTLKMVEDGALFFWEILHAPTPRLAVENPAPMGITYLPPYNQIIQPYQFGDPYSKRVCLWLRGLPPLLPTSAPVISKGSWLRHCASTSRRRSKTFNGIANAMAMQWGLDCSIWD